MKITSENDMMCLVYYDRPMYKFLAENAYNTFTHFHPDFDTYFVTDVDYKRYKCSSLKKYSSGMAKYAIAHEINERSGNKYKKVVCLGADTLTLARLDEFIDDDHTQMLCTLDYGYPLEQNGEFIAPADKHCNADVICFNDFDIIPTIVKDAINYTRAKCRYGPVYNEQASINRMIRDNRCSWDIVDSKDRNVFYNVRAKRTDIWDTIPYPSNRLKEFSIEDGAVFDQDENQLKVWHYCEGFGLRQRAEVNQRIKALSDFTPEVRAFIRNIGARNFFNG